MQGKCAQSQGSDCHFNPTLLRSPAALPRESTITGVSDSTPAGGLRQQMQCSDTSFPPCWNTLLPQQRVHTVFVHGCTSPIICLADSGTDACRRQEM